LLRAGKRRLLASANPNRYGRVLAFKLNGAAALPPYKPEIKPANAVPNTWDEATVKHGADAYGTCVFCHGFAAESNGVVPDLRRSTLLGDKAGWASVVLEGAFESEGMPNLSSRVSPEDAEAIRAYVASRARQLARDENLQAQVEH
jgi:quinohemoprotein ethanol dehydrogenase